MYGLSRRELLQSGMVGGLAALLSTHGVASESSLPVRAKSVIHIFLTGGIAQQESFDPKPQSSIECRGQVVPIATQLPGVQFNHLLPKTAQLADRVTICRGMTHVLADHDAGVHQMLTGYAPSPALKYPSMGSIVAQQFGSRKQLPPYICIPRKQNAAAGSGYLDSSLEPFGLGSDPPATDFKVRDLAPPASVKTDRLVRARKLLDKVNSQLGELGRQNHVGAMDAFYQQAFRMITSKPAQAAFDLSLESEKTKSDYGMGKAGQRMLAARRLAEAGARFVSMTYGDWDSHFNIDPSIKRQLPPFDQAYSALIRDLDDRGLLDTTLVVVTTEFGRTPKINANAGRDHWAKSFTVLLAGGGVKRGYVHGKTDAQAAEVVDEAVGVQDLLATIYHLVGIDASRELMAPGDRPIDIVHDGHVVREMLA